MRAFASAPTSFAPILSWLWNGNLQEDVIRQQLRAMRAAGFGGVVLRAAHGHTTDYLSDEWLHLARLGVQECESLGLKVWLGDEDGGASGTCGGSIPAHYPELSSYYLKFHTQDVAAIDALSWRPPPVTGTLLYAIAMPLIGTPPKPDFARAATLTRVAPERAAGLIADLGTHARVFTFSQERGSYIDLMNPEAARRFLDSTHERYRVAVGDHFGATVAGLFVNSPTLWPPTESGDTQRFPWSPLMLDFFTKHIGYDLLEWLPALIADFGDDAARLRQEFWQAIIHLTHEGFWKPITTWAEQHELTYSGTVRGQEPINSMVAQQGDAVAAYRILNPPGVAASGLQASQHLLSLGRGLDARLSASIATFGGKPRVVAELWGASGWSATLQERMASLHHLLRQGVNCFVPNASFYSIRGQRRRQAPPSEMHQPYWTQWKTLADYIARCSYALGQGKTGARVGLLWPIRSAWAHHHPRGHRLTRWVEEDLYASALLLDEINFEFLLLPEDDLCAAQCEEASLLCGVAQVPLEMIVLPSVTTLSWAAWRKLEEFVAHGGKVVCLGLLPRWSERGRDREMETHVGKTMSVVISDLYESYAIMENAGQAPTTVGYPITREDVSGGRWNCYQPRLNSDIKDAFLRVRKLLKESLTPELETQATDILYTRRILEEIEEELEALAPEPSVPLGALEVLAELGITQKVDAPTSDVAEEAPHDDSFDWDQPFDWDAADNPSAGRGSANTIRGHAPDRDSAAAAASGALGTEVAADAAESDDNLADNLLVADTSLSSAEYLLSGGDLFFIFNAAEEHQHINLRLRPARPGTPHDLDAWTGEIRKLPVWMPFPPEDGGGLSLSLELAALESRLIWIRPAANEQKPRNDNIERATFTVEAFDGRVASGYATENGIHRIAVRQGDKLGRYNSEEVTVPPPILFEDNWNAVRRGPNVLLVPDWQWQHGRNELGSNRWFGGEKWQPVPARQNLDPNALTKLDTTTAIDLNAIITFLTTFEVASSPNSLYLQFDPLDTAFKLYLNGEPLDPCAPPYPNEPQWAAAEWQWFDLSIAEIGKNTLACLVDYRERKPVANPRYTPDLVPEAPRLIGDFSLTEKLAIKGTEPMLLAAGSWHDQGLPFYSGAVEYRQWVNIPASWNGCRVYLEMSRMRDVAAVWMNGRACGTRITEPYRFDVTRRVLKGAANEVRLRVWNTAGAALEGHLRPPPPAGMLGPVRIVAYPIVYPMVEAKEVS